MQGKTSWVSVHACERRQSQFFLEARVCANSCMASIFNGRAIRSLVSNTSPPTVGCGLLQDSGGDRSTRIASEVIAEYEAELADAAAMRGAVKYLKPFAGGGPSRFQTSIGSCAERAPAGSGA